LKLEFLHIHSSYGDMPCGPKDVLRCHLPRLESFIINDRIWKVQHSLDGTMRIRSLPLWRYYVRSDLDFPDEEVAWLNTHNYGEWYGKGDEDEDGDKDEEDDDNDDDEY
jgi:hypothetical protein